LENEALHDLFDDIVTFEQTDVKNILVIEDNKLESSLIAKMLGADDIVISIAETGEKAIQKMRNTQFDCIIVDYSLPDISGENLLSTVSQNKKKQTPVIIYSAKDFNKRELQNLHHQSNSILLKGADSLERLLEETVLQLHINHKDLVLEKRKVIENIRKKEDILSGKNVLVVDDDVRNLFALMTVFERYNINVITAESGKEAINIINESDPAIDMVLMDIMMPEMDGYETTQKIRREHKNSSLPLLQ
jgi:CheY-like chemotaxis protein